jgi:hypothetical protein
MTQPARVNVLLPGHEAERFEAYCKMQGFKKSTLIVRLIREHLDRESFDERRSQRTAKRGRIEGQNLTVIPNGFDVRNDQLAERAAALVNAAPDAIVGGPELPLRALQALTTTIPLISMTADMVAAGLVASLARPGVTRQGSVYSLMS